MNIRKRRIVGLFITLAVLTGGYFIWAYHDMDESYRQGMYESGMYKVIVADFRRYFHGRNHYEALTLDQLHNQGILSETAYEYIRSNSFSYHPFSPSTSDHEPVLRLGWPLIGVGIHKGDLTAGMSDPDVIVSK